MLDPGAGAVPLAAAAGDALTEKPESISIIVGPEGGFDDAEVQGCEESGAVRVSLGATILRTETAAVAALAVLRSLVDAS